MRILKMVIRIVRFLIHLIVIISFSLLQNSCKNSVVEPSIPSLQERINYFWGGYNELGEGRMTYTVLPLDTTYFTEIIPLGHLFPPGHPIPTSHTYWILSRNNWGGQEDGFNKPVRAPANGVITNIIFTKWENYPDYSVHIRHSNSFLTIFNHLSSIDQKILDKIGYPLKEGYNGNKVNILVLAGDTLGKSSADYGQSAALDMGAYDRNVLSYIHPEKYPIPSQQAISPLDNFSLEMKELLFKKVKRIAEPRGGKYDFDVQGKLAGNWFIEGTDGWKNGDGFKNYLSFVYDVYDPVYLRISIGEKLDGGLYRVKNNSPDFKDISINSGKVVYHLIPTREGVEFLGWIDYYSQTVTKTLLVQMLNDEKIKVELFDGEIQSPNFTGNAKFFTR